MGEERAAESPPCHIAKTMHHTALENTEDVKTLTSQCPFCSKFFYGRNNHEHLLLKKAGYNSRCKGHPNKIVHT